jgi:multicomponent K+:H+ antiporter subunit A
MRGIDAAAARMVRVQDGRLRRYLVAMLVAVGVLLALFGAVPLPGGNPHGDTSAAGWVRAFAALAALGAAMVSARLRSDILAVLALAASGLSVALYIALEPAVDVAWVQVVVDILTTVLLILALKHLPRAPSAAAAKPSPGAAADRLRGLALAVAAGAVMAAVAYAALESRPRESAVTPFYEANAVARTGASDVVGAIVVDFRGYDTLIEITVFGAAGLAVALLLRGAARRRVAVAAAGRADATRGIAGPRTSVFLQGFAWVVLPLALMLAATRILYGHDQPGDGFTAGVTVSLGVALWQFVFGPGVTWRRLRWARPRPLIGAGLALAMAGAAAPVLAGQAFFSPFDFGHAVGLPLPPGVHLGAAMIFELAICLTVLGSAVHMLESLGDPRTVAGTETPS